ncbi:MAG: hypothetical protein KH321_03300 [Clostridium sp.]|nr:hypothetical protein [Clostridium sp.]
MTTYEIELEKTNANQEFDIVIDEIENSIHILLQTVNDILLMSLFVNSEQIGQPFMCFPNQPVVPYPYMQKLLGGNFIFETQDDNYPSYENFGSTCKLYFVTLDEIN